jgi:hypothetical protein
MRGERTASNDFRAICQKLTCAPSANQSKRHSFASAAGHAPIHHHCPHQLPTLRLVHSFIHELTNFREFCFASIRPIGPMNPIFEWCLTIAKVAGLIAPFSKQHHIGLKTHQPSANENHLERPPATGSVPASGLFCHRLGFILDSGPSRGAAPAHSPVSGSASTLL